MGVYSGNRTFLGETYADDFSGHVLDLALEAERNDLKMFEAVINTDFIQAYNEAGVISLNEADEAAAKEKSKDGIIKKAKELLKKIGAAITTAIKNFIAKIRNATANDNKIIAKYKKYFSDKNSIKALKLPTSCRRIKEVDIKGSMWSKKDELDKLIAKIDSATDADEVSKILESLMKVDKDGANDAIKMHSISSAEFEEMIFDKKPEGDWNPTDKDIDVITGWMDGGNLAVKECKDTEKVVLSQLDKSKKALDLDKRTAGDDQLAVAKANAKYKATTKVGQILTKYCNMMCNGAARQLAMARKEYIILGNKAAKNATVAAGESTTFEDYALGEMSDSYMEAALLSM